MSSKTPTKRVRINDKPHTDKKKDTNIPSIPVYTLHVVDTAPHNVYSIPNKIDRYIYVTSHIDPNQPEQYSNEDPYDYGTDDDYNEDKYEYIRRKRSILVFGIPITWSDYQIYDAFNIFGEIEAVYEHGSNKDPLSRVYVVVFETIDECNKVYIQCTNMIRIDTDSIISHNSSNTTTTTPPPSTSINTNGNDDNDDNTALAAPTAYINECREGLGLAKWDYQYYHLRPDYSTLEQQINMFMQAFDERMANEKKAYRAHGKTVVDNEGFTLVTADPKTLKIEKRRQKQHAKMKAKQFDDKIQKQRDAGVAFYKYHETERLKREQSTLQNNFSRDIKHIEGMKKSKKFTPL